MPFQTVLQFNLGDIQEAAQRKKTIPVINSAWSQRNSLTMKRNKADLCTGFILLYKIYSMPKLAKLKEMCLTEISSNLK